MPIAAISSSRGWGRPSASTARIRFSVGVKRGTAGSPAQDEGVLRFPYGMCEGKEKKRPGRRKAAAPQGCGGGAGRDVAARWPVSPKHTSAPPGGNTTRVTRRGRAARGDPVLLWWGSGVAWG